MYNVRKKEKKNMYPHFRLKLERIGVSRGGGMSVYRAIGESCSRSSQSEAREESREGLPISEPQARIA